MRMVLRVLPLFLLFAPSDIAQTGKEAVGNVEAVTADACTKGLADQLWNSAGRPNTSSPSLATTISPLSSCQRDEAETPYAALIIHGAVWNYDSANKAVQQKYGEWQIYHPKMIGKTPSLQQDQQSGWPLTPPLYAHSRVLLVGVSCFYDTSGTEVDAFGQVNISYKVSTTQVTPANLANLQSVLKAWLGVSAAAAAQAKNCQKGLIASYEISDKLPYDISITTTAAIVGGQPPKQTQNCSTSTTTSCTNSARTFHNLDAEFWDLSSGAMLPGVREPHYSPTNPATQIAPVRHTDFNLLLDLYPFAPIASKSSPIPHFAVGIPVTGKVFYRPFFGIAECLTCAPKFQNHSIPQISALFGVVYLNQEVTIPNPSGSGLAIGHSRVVKGTFGLEISLSPLLSKIKAIGGGSNNTGGGTQTTKGTTGGS